MAIPFLNSINLSNNELQNAKLHITGSLPAPAKGHIYFDSSANKVKVHDGTTLQTVAWESWVTANYPGTVTSVSSATTNQLTITNETTTPSLTIVTGAVVDGGTALATGDQIYDFVTGLGYVESVSGGTYLTNSGTATAVILDHDATSRTDTTSSDTPAFGGTFEAVTSVTTNAEGHVTAIDVSTVTIPASDNTDVDVSVANLITRLGQISQDVTIGDAADVTVIIPGDLQVTGTTITNNVETVSTSNGVVFEGNVAADGNELTLLAGTLTADRTITLPDATGTVALTSELHDAVTLAGSYDYITLAGQVLTLNQIDYTTDIANAPTIPSPANNAIITVSASSGLTGGGDFTTDQSFNETITLSHADTSSQVSVNNSEVTVIQDVTLDTYGHVTGLASVDLSDAIAEGGKETLKISGNGTTTTFTLIHALGTPLISTEILDYGDNGTGATYERVFADVRATSGQETTRIDVSFANAPSATQDYLVLLTKFPALLE